MTIRLALDHLYGLSSPSVAMAALSELMQTEGCPRRAWAVCMAVSLASALCGYRHEAVAGPVIQPPTVVPFALGLQGKTAFKFEVAERRTYAVGLQYHYKDPVHRAKLWKLAGGARKDATGQHVEPGAAVRVHLAITRSTPGSLPAVIDKTVQNPKLSSWSGSTLNAELMEVTLEPGAYWLTAESLDKASSLAGERIEISVTQAYRGK